MNIYNETNLDSLDNLKIPAALIGAAGIGLLVSKLSRKNKTRDKWGLTNKKKDHTNGQIRDVIDDLSSSWVKPKK